LTYYVEKNHRKKVEKVLKVTKNSRKDIPKLLVNIS